MWIDQQKSCGIFEIITLQWYLLRLLKLVTYSWFGRWLCDGQLAKLNVFTLPVRPVWNWKHPGYRLKNCKSAIKLGLKISTLRILREKTNLYSFEQGSWVTLTS